MDLLASPTFRPQGLLLAWSSRLAHEASETVIRSARLRADRKALLQRRAELVAERRALLKERHELLRRARSAPFGYPATASEKPSSEPCPRLGPP